MIMFNSRIVNVRDFVLENPIDNMPFTGTAYACVFYYPETKSLVVNNTHITEETAINIIEAAIIRMELGDTRTSLVEAHIPTVSHTVYAAVFYHCDTKRLSIHTCGLEEQGAIDLLRLGRNQLLESIHVPTI